MLKRSSQFRINARIQMFTIYLQGMRLGKIGLIMSRHDLSQSHVEYSFGLSENAKLASSSSTYL